MTASASVTTNTLLDVRDLKMHFPIRRGLLKSVVGHVRAVDGVNFTIRKGETLGLVGESGCGKTTAGRCVVRAYAPSHGEIRYYDAAEAVGDAAKQRVHARHADGTDTAHPVGFIDFAKLNQQELRAYRHEIQMIFQDPYSSLNPRMTVLDIVSEPLVIHTRKTPKQLKN